MKDKDIVVILSGEGVGPGTYKSYRGSLSPRAVKARLKKEECGGARWAKALVYSHTNELGPVWEDYWGVEGNLPGPNPEDYA